MLLPRRARGSAPRARVLCSRLMVQGWYEVDEVAQLTGLKASSIRRYAHETTLIRGADFTTLRRYRFGRQNQKLVFSKRVGSRAVRRHKSRASPVRSGRKY